VLTIDLPCSPLAPDRSPVRIRYRDAGEEPAIVFLHGGTLARHDMKNKKEIWSVNLINEKDIDAQVAKEMEEAKKDIDWANSNTPESVPKMPRPDKLKKELMREAATPQTLARRDSRKTV